MNSNLTLINSNYRLTVYDTSNNIISVPVRNQKNIEQLDPDTKAYSILYNYESNINTYFIFINLEILTTDRILQMESGQRALLLKKFLV